MRGASARFSRTQHSAVGGVAPALIEDRQRVRRPIDQRTVPRASLTQLQSEPIRVAIGKAERGDSECHWRPSHSRPVDVSVEPRCAASVRVMGRPIESTKTEAAEIRADLRARGTLIEHGREIEAFVSARVTLGRFARGIVPKPLPRTRAMFAPGMDARPKIRARGQRTLLRPRSPPSMRRSQPRPRPGHRRKRRTRRTTGRLCEQSAGLCMALLVANSRSRCHAAVATRIHAAAGLGSCSDSQPPTIGRGFHPRECRLDHSFVSAVGSSAPCRTRSRAATPSGSCGD